MTINQSNPRGWVQNDTLTSSQANTIDQNSTYALDKRDGQIDNLQSIVHVSGEVEFTDGYLFITNPANVTFRPDLVCDAEIIGDSSQSKQLDFGVVNVPIGGNTILQNYQYNNFVIQLTQNGVAGTFSLTLPTQVGFTKIIDNETNFTANIKLDNSSTTIFSIPTKKSIVVFCDGTTLSMVAAKSKYQLIDFRNYHNANGFNSLYQTITHNTIGNKITGCSFTFSPVQTGDIFDIKFRASYSKPEDTTQFSIDGYVNNTKQNYLSIIYQSILWTGLSTKGSSYSSGTYTAASNSDITIDLRAMLATIGTTDGYVAAPLSFTVFQWRP